MGPGAPPRSPENAVPGARCRRGPMPEPELAARGGESSARDPTPPPPGAEAALARDPLTVASPRAVPLPLCRSPVPQPSRLTP
eukprot:521399-Prymnesium_polylepis.1